MSFGVQLLLRRNRRRECDASGLGRCALLPSLLSVEGRTEHLIEYNR